MLVFPWVSRYRTKGAASPAVVRTCPLFSSKLEGATETVDVLMAGLFVAKSTSGSACIAPLANANAAVIEKQREENCIMRRGIDGLTESDRVKSM